MKIRLELRPNDSVIVGDVVITLEQKSGQRARFTVAAPGTPTICKVEGMGSETAPVRLMTQDAT